MTTDLERLHEIESACPGADADFLLSQVEAEATADSALRAWCQKLRTENSELRQRVQELDAAAIATRSAHDQELAELRTSFAADLSRIKARSYFSPQAFQPAETLTAKAEDADAVAREMEPVSADCGGQPV